MAKSGDKEIIPGLGLEDVFERQIEENASTWNPIFEEINEKLVKEYKKDHVVLVRGSVVIYLEKNKIPKEYTYIIVYHYKKWGKVCVYPDVNSIEFYSEDPHSNSFSASNK